MLIDLQDGGPDDWMPTSPAPSVSDDGPDDWIAPAGTGQDQYPDDWMPAAPSGADNQRIARASTGDPRAYLWPSIQGGSAGAGPWAPPAFPGAYSSSPPPQHLPQLVAPLIAADGMPGSLGRMPTSDRPVPGWGNNDLFGGTNWPAKNLVSSFQWQPGSSDRTLGSEGSTSIGGGGFPQARVQQSSLETGDTGRSGWNPRFGSSLGQNGPPASNFSDGTDDPSGPGNTPNPDTNLDEPGSITRLIRDSSGKPLAILRLQPNQANASPAGAWSDAQPDGARAGDRYAQIIEKSNNAVTGNPFIDRTTGFLLDTLEQSVLAMGSGFGNVFGTKVHTDFATRVRALDLPGIGKTGVEQSFDFDIKNLLFLGSKYGAAGSIRTDVALGDPKSPDQRPIAVYDLKTGNAVLTPAREAQLREKLGQRKDLPIIVLEYKTGNAIFPSR